MRVPIGMWGLMLLSGAAAAARGAGADDALLQSVRSRQAQVTELISGCKAQEGFDGVLRALPNAGPEDYSLIQRENEDRDRVWERIATESSVSKEDVTQMFATRAIRRNRTACVTDSGESSNRTACVLKPLPPADVTRLLVYLKQGIRFAERGSFQNALHEFEQVVRIDPHFPSAHKNIGSAKLRLKQYGGAEEAFQQEHKALDCLTAQTDASLKPFCYFIEPGASEIQIEECRRRLNDVRATTYYSQACLFSMRGQLEKSLTALRKAREGGFRDRRAIATDPDLAAFRASRHYQAFVN